MSTRPFEAMYAGRCDANGCAIEVGDRIAYADGYDKPLCESCWRADQAPPPPVCPHCYTVHAGDCW